MTADRRSVAPHGFGGRRASVFGGSSGHPGGDRACADVAATLASTNGLAAVTIQSVAIAAGYIRPIVYDCFGSREDVVALIVSTAAESLRRRLRITESALSARGNVEDVGAMAYIDLLLEGQVDSFTSTGNAEECICQQEMNRRRSGSPLVGMGACGQPCPSPAR
ncbi:TetR/AcrR family transcriptional regulator [Gordonia sp. TBRC 11910]|uniref:TetR/AcrR family transcriptional regulator n=1 Tax=Gordonia asplenii TaxID=2725283 RepID=A0A848KU82_9ACTN|nr:TetR/AcrR family transcriptional regulator [Gordonia asplenii]